MKAPRKILVPTDFSRFADEALAWACDLAKRYDAELTLLHVYQIPALALPEGYVLPRPEAMSDLMGKLDEALRGERKKAEAAGVKEVRTVLAEGTPFAEIVRVAREGRHDLIVMGTHGHTGLTHALLGSVAEKVVRKAGCPVMVVRRPYQEIEQPRGGTP